MGARPSTALHGWSNGSDWYRAERTDSEAEVNAMATSPAVPYNKGIKTFFERLLPPGAVLRLHTRRT